jgi:phage terminase small subunit
MNRNQWIVITSISAPTPGIEKLARLAGDWTILVVGDLKTPRNWRQEGVRYLSVDEQTTLHFNLAKSAPFNHYARKNLGYLYAIGEGAQLIAETDDDNFPYDNYPGQLEQKITARRIVKGGWVNVFRHFTTKQIWPRGFPLELVNTSFQGTVPSGVPGKHLCAIQQFLADQDPDVDAVYRLTSGEEEVYFDKSEIVLGPGAWCPFNSQNTFWWPTAFLLLYLPFLVSFRMTDTWRSYVAQVCHYVAGGNIAFRAATVRHTRNPHSLIRDFSDEITGYLNNRAIIDHLSHLPLSSQPENAGDNLRSCYRALAKLGLVPAEELALLEMWIEDYTTAADSGARRRALSSDKRARAAGGSGWIYGVSGVPELDHWSWGPRK